MNKARILIVEDEAIVVRDLRQELDALGYEPVADTPRGEEAVDLAGQWRPDLVLMDIRLAGAMDGIAAAQAIREKFALPVVFLTAFAGDEVLHRAKLTEPFGYIVKPFDARELRTVIEMALYKHKIEAGLRRSYEEQASLLRSALDGFWLVDRQGRFLDVNDAYCRMTGFSREEMLQKSIGDFEFDETPAEIAAQIARIVTAGAARFERRQRRRDGRLIDVELSVNYLPVGEGRLFCLVRDVTERKLLEEERELKVRLLALANGLGDRHELMQALTLLLRDASGCEAVGIRLKQGDDFPYFETRGFPAEFVRAENRLCRLGANGLPERDRDGHPVLECLCGDVLGGRGDPSKPWFTMHGSFWTNSTTEFLANTTEADRPAHLRSRCHHAGYESLALVPLRVGGTTFGLLQLNDRRRDRFAPERIELFEHLADTLAVVLAERQAREETRHSEAKFRSYLEHAPLGVLVIDGAGRYVEVNPAGARMLGYTEAELLQRHVAEIQAAEAGDAGARRIARLRAGEGFDEVGRLRRKDGTEFWANLVAVRLADDRFLAFVQDVTARRQAETALRESEEKFAKVFHDAPVWIAITDLADGTYVDVNEYGLKAAGFTREEVLGHTPVELGWLEVHERARLVQAIQEHGSVADMELRSRAKDGRVLYGLVNGEKITIGGRPCLLTATVDITARRQVEAELRESAAKLRAMFDCSRDAIGVSKRGRHVFANLAYLKLFGFEESADLVGKPIFDLIAPSDRPMMVQNVQRRAAGEAVAKFYQVRCLRADGTEFDAEFSVSTYELGGESFTMAAIRDITERRQAETTLRESEERYRTLVELSPEAIIVHARGRVIFANQASARLAGAETAEALLGVQVMDFVQPESREAVAQRIEKMATGGGLAPLMRQKWRRLDGTPIEVEVVAKALSFGGQPATLVIALDVTAQRQTEAELRKLSRAVEQSPVTVVITDVTGAIEYVNPSFTATCGYTLDEARGMNPRILQSGELTPEIYRDLWTTITAGREWRGEFHNRKKSGALFWEAATVSPITDEQGNITHFLAVKEDITERKAADVRLREQAALLEVTQDAILVLELDRTITFWNRGAEKLYGVDRVQAVGRRYEAIAYSELPANYDEEWRQFIERGAWSAERRQVSATRGAITVQVRATLVRDEQERAKSALIVVTDVTESKKLETQFLRAQRLDSLGALASGVAHDLNNVLTPILMSVELLRPLVRAKGDSDLLQLLSDSARRGADIVQQLLLFGRGSDAPRAPMNAAGVIKEVGQMMRQTFPKNLVLGVQAPADLWLIEADRTQLHQAILNLCVNARDAMPHGGRLAVTAENLHVDEALARNNGAKGAGPYVRLEVRDTGVGIPARHIEKIFDPFFTTKPIGEGTGLGLATVLGIVRSHGGFLTVSSQERIGTVFEVFLPAAKSAVEASVASEARAALMGRGECVLVVEDEEAIRGMLQRLLTGENYQVLVATDGAEALGVYSQNAERVKLIVTDMMMPTMDGTQMMTALRRMRPGLPVVAISGLPSHRADFERKFAPRVRFLPKPFPSDLALCLVREALDEAYGPKEGATT